MREAEYLRAGASWPPFYRRRGVYCPRDNRSGRIILGATRGYNYNLPMHDVVVYSREGCHLCDVVKETIRKLQQVADFRWHEVDIDAEPELRRKYNDEVPVVFIDGRKAFKYRMDEREFLRVLAARVK